MPIVAAIAAAHGGTTLTSPVRGSMYFASGWTSEETEMAGNEPDLRAGDSGEWVTHLQQRLYDLSRYDGSVDGFYGETTEAAVRQLHESAGVQDEGGVSWQTWQSLAEQEQQAGITTYSQQDDGSAESGESELAVGQLSEDGQWRWDGSDWQAVAQEPVTETQNGEDVLSEDGQWRWDGSDWQAVTQESGAEAEPHEVLINDAVDDPATEEAVAPG